MTFVFDDSAFEPQWTVDKFLFMVASHAIILFGVGIFTYIKKYDFALCGLLTGGVSFFYHFIQLGMAGHQHLVFAHMGDFTMIMVTFNVFFFSLYRLDYEKRFLLTILMFPFPFIVGVVAYSSYAIVVVIVANFILLLFLNHQYNVERYKGRYALDRFNLLCLTIIVLFTAAALFFFYWGGNPGDIHYSYRHNTWHFFVFLIYDVISLVYLKQYHEIKEQILRFERDVGLLSEKKKYRMIRDGVISAEMTKHENTRRLMEAEAKERQRRERELKVQEEAASIVAIVSPPKTPPPAASFSTSSSPDSSSDTEGAEEDDDEETGEFTAFKINE